MAKPREPHKRFSFLEDQEYQRKRDEAAAAAAAEREYQYGWRDVLLFVYFCANVFVLGISMINSNALLKIWRLTEAFRSECTNPDDYEGGWCPEQADCAKITLVLFQSAAAATALMGGTLVDTFTASMCLLVAHIMYAAGSHLLSKPGTRGIFVAAVLQGGAGELLLNSVLPICGLFGKHQNTMMLVLAFFFDLSVLTYPVILHFVAPSSPLADPQCQFYSAFHSYVVWFAIICAAVGTFVLPVDDSGAIVPITTMATMQSVNKKPHGTLASSAYQRVVGGQDFRDVEVVIDPSTDDDDDDLFNDEVSLLLPNSPGELAAHSKKTPRSLSALRFTKKLFTVQFFVVLAIFSTTTMRNSFFLNNSHSLQEAAGDNGTMAQAFMWLLGVGTILSPVAWQLNDNSATSPFCLVALCTVALLVNALAALGYLTLHWAAMVLWVASRCLLAPTVLTYIARCFGFKHLPGIAVVVGLLGAFANFLNISLDRFTEAQLQGDYRVANYIMLGLGAIACLCVLLHHMFPIVEAPDVAQEETLDRQPQRDAAVPPEPRVSPAARAPGPVAGGIEDDENEWEDE